MTSRPTGGTDHQSFDRVGLPGFQFIQDEMDYDSRTHHTNLDTYDHLHRDDLVQASVVMANRRSSGHKPREITDAADRSDCFTAPTEG